MGYTRRTLIILLLALSLLLAVLVTSFTYCWIGLNFFAGGFSKPVSSGERQLRLGVVAEAKTHLGVVEGSSGHQQILDIYNTHTPLARDYEVQLSDNWCATYGSAIAVSQGLTQIIPTECGCERQIELWKEMGNWTENGAHLPLPGDYIYYNWDHTWNFKDNDGWADHVGIVVGSFGPAIKVIEGNRSDMVTYRILFRWDYRIRGYGLPDYASIG